MRRLYLIAYDIRQDKRLRKVHRCLQGFGDALQYSVFAAILSPAEKARLIAALHPLIQHREDTVMIADLGPHEGHTARSIEYLGQHPPAMPSREPLVL